MARRGRPKAIWAVVCTDGTPTKCSGPRDARGTEKRYSVWCPLCGLAGRPHRVVEYRPVEEASDG